MDAYLKFRALNYWNEGLVQLDRLNSLINHSLRIIEWKCSNHIILQSLEPGTCACAIGRLEWRVAKSVMNFIDDSIKVNSIIIDVLRIL
jgi:hypothetical protein